jgi:hypothetical protein
MDFSIKRIGNLIIEITTYPNKISWANEKTRMANLKEGIYAINIIESDKRNENEVSRILLEEKHLKHIIGELKRIEEKPAYEEFYD